MTYSMTAFAKHLEHFELGDLQWEIRSVNHRFLDCHLRLPENLKHLDTKIRSTIKDTLHRGKIDVSLCFSATEKENLFSLDTALVQQLAKLSTQIQTHYPQSQVMTQNEILTWPGVLNSKINISNNIEKQVLNSLANALEKLKQTRKEEGVALHKIILGKHEKISEQIQAIDALRPCIIEKRTQTLKDYFVQARVECDPNRFEQEMLIFAQKIDITEEIDRAQTHLQAFLKTMQTSGPIGRRIDFLTQELLREVNTICSKTTDSKITHFAIEIKTLLEQIREQIQNVE